MASDSRARPRIAPARRALWLPQDLLISECPRSPSDSDSARALRRGSGRVPGCGADNHRRNLLQDLKLPSTRPGALTGALNASEAHG
eukprot:757490-Hanusia_phi.AAC.9